MNVVTEAGTRETVFKAEEEEEMDTGADGRMQKYEEEEGSEDSLFSGSDQDEDSNSRPSKHTACTTDTKKRPSPDTDAIRTLPSPGSQRYAKRAKLEAFRSLARAFGIPETSSGPRCQYARSAQRL